MTDIILRLLFAHFIGDVALQSEYLCRMKHESILFLTAHSFIYGATIYFMMGNSQLFGWVATISHFIIDRLKIKHEIGFVEDQFFHGLILVVLGVVCYVQSYLM